MRRNEELIALCLDAVKQGATSIDEVMASLGMPPSAAMSARRNEVTYALMNLEKDGSITWPRSPNGGFIAGGIRACS